MSTVIGLEAARVEPHTGPTPRTVRVALAGCGVVGGALLRLIREHGERIEAEHGLRFELASVLVRDRGRPRSVELAPGLLTTDPGSFLRADADLLVEAIGGLEPAGEIACAALARGKRLVTANKALLASRGTDLALLARRHGGRLDFEAAVGGGVPVIRVLRESLAGTGIRSVRGVLNGTCNFILSRLAEGLSFADALRGAQAAGFAEADPSRDVNGEDAADKIAILAWLAFGLDPARLKIRRRGILPDPDRLARVAAAFGGVVRLVAECVLLPGGVSATVEPVVVAPDSEIGRVRDEENVVLIETRDCGRIRLGGPGAGGAATASALLGDMISAAQGAVATAGDRPTIPDERPHRWLVGVAGGAAAAEAAQGALDAAGIGTDALRGASDGRALLARPCPWPRIEEALDAIDGAGTRPVVARCELEGWG